MIPFGCAGGFHDTRIASLATTSGGDGVRSAPIHCQTDQDSKLINQLIHEFMLINLFYSQLLMHQQLSKL